ncbi:hypothetical protein ACFY1L_09790 [Streptomyces sp. NPDC001663]|uniref:hypothetical protein n=1 Tax=Streptomyces sp. NPDC001663 TaxID=3364597 RepID=UPI0036B9410C
MTASATNFILHPSLAEEGDGIWFATPAGFTTLPLEALLEPATSPGAAELREALAPILASAPDELSRQSFMANLSAAQRMVNILRVAGTVHCSLGLHRDDTGDGDGGVLLSLFAVGWVATAWAPRGVNAARAVATAEGHTDIEYAELPCGPATFSETVRTPTAESGLPRQPLLQIHANLPHPDGNRLAVLTLSTTAVAHREHYRDILRQIAGMASFEDPFSPVADEQERGRKRELS